MLKILLDDNLEFVERLKVFKLFVIVVEKVGNI